MPATSLQSYRRTVLRFLLVFCALGAASSGLETWMRAQRIGGNYQRALANIAGGISRAMGSDARMESSAGTPTISVGAMRLAVTLECTAVLPTGLFLSAVLAVPCPLRKRLVGLLVGLAGVALLNVLRIVILILVAQYRASWFETFHDVLMQGFLLIFVAPLWMAWMVWATADAPKPQATRPRRKSARPLE